MEARNPKYREFVEMGFARAGFSSGNGIRLLDCGPGWVMAEVKLEARHMQQMGVAHGGLVATLADHAAGGAAATLLPAEEIGVTAEIKLSYLRPARGERLECRAAVIKPGRAVCFVEAEVFAIQDGKRELVAKASATMAVVLIN
ncbi:MAG: PaaI family thioesterase [Burkholderiales bacterium]|nr:PaaI family thioesterase [Burkholderiales bacterium]